LRLLGAERNQQPLPVRVIKQTQYFQFNNNSQMQKI
jgi:hypothetical protein